MWYLWQWQLTSNCITVFSVNTSVSRSASHVEWFKNYVRVCESGLLLDFQSYVTLIIVVYESFMNSCLSGLYVRREAYFTIFEISRWDSLLQWLWVRVFDNVSVTLRRAPLLPGYEEKPCYVPQPMGPARMRSPVLVSYKIDSKIPFKVGQQVLILCEERSAQGYESIISLKPLLLDKRLNETKGETLSK